jgi:hypothetical protein
MDWLKSLRLSLREVISPEKEGYKTQETYDDIESTCNVLDSSSSSKEEEGDEDRMNLSEDKELDSHGSGDKKDTIKERCKHIFVPQNTLQTRTSRPTEGQDVLNLFIHRYPSKVQCFLCAQSVCSVESSPNFSSLQNN